MSPVKRQTVLVIGASGGMGSALLELLPSDQFDFILVDRRTGRKNKAPTVRQINGMDMSQPQVVKRLAQTLRREGRQLDWVINLVGWVGERATIFEQTQAIIDKLIAVNLLASIYVARELTPLLKSGGGIVNVSSTAGLRPNGRYAIYSATKAALTAFTQAMARGASDLLPKNLSFITVCPGPTNTPMRQKLAGDATNHQSPVIVGKIIKKIIAGSYRNGDVILVEQGRSRLLSRFA